jgi:hypothetical protein
MLHTSALLLLSTRTLAQYVQPYKITYASADPIGARDFTIKYLGTIEKKQPHAGGDGQCALIKWVAFPGTNTGSEPYQMHFVKGYHRPNGTMTIDQFEDQMAALHGNMGTYDRFMDFHVTMRANDLDVFAAPMLRDGVPLLARKDVSSGLYSIFFEVPHAIIVELVGPTLTVLNAPTWNRCASPKRPESVDKVALERVHAQMAAAPNRLPILQPVRAVFASSQPEADAAFVAKAFMGKQVADASALPGSGNGTCYDAQLVRWVNPKQDTPYDMMFIRSSAPQGSGISLAQFEDYLRTLHTSNISEHDQEVGYDEYMDFHIGLTFEDGDPLAHGLIDTNVPFFLRGQYGAFCDFFIEGPGGQIFEVLAHEQTIFKSIPDWNLCGPIPSFSAAAAVVEALPS